MKRRRAVMTMVHNEAVLLPLWLRWAAQTFAPEDIYVIDHDTTDGSVEAARELVPFKTFPAHRSTWHDSAWMSRMVRKYFARLLKRYELVLYLDVDEVLVPDPDRYVDLAHYFAEFKDESARFDTRSVMHMPDEPDLDPSKSILSQRSHWFREPMWHKAIFSSRVLEWTVGQHFLAEDGDLIREEDLDYDRDVLLLHLHRVDYATCIAKREAGHREPWGSEPGQAIQHRISGELLDAWFYAPLGATEEIPERFWDLI